MIGKPQVAVRCDNIVPGDDGKPGQCKHSFSISLDFMPADLEAAVFALAPGWHPLGQKRALCPQCKEVLQGQMYAKRAAAKAQTQPIDPS